MARPSRTGGKTSRAKARNASAAKGGTPKTRSQKAPSKSKKASRTKSSITDLKEQTERKDASEEHIKKCLAKLKVLMEQKNDMQLAFDEMMEDIDRKSVV